MAKTSTKASKSGATRSEEEQVHDSFEEHSKLFRDLLLGFVKVHVLHHASRGPVYGVGIGGELDRHGYHLSPGTLYPLLHTLETAKFLQRDDQVVEGKVRKYYEITPLGQKALEEARHKILELVEEIFEDEAPELTASLGSAALEKRPASKDEARRKILELVDEIFDEEDEPVAKSSGDRSG